MNQFLLICNISEVDMLHNTLIVMAQKNSQQMVKLFAQSRLIFFLIKILDNSRMKNLQFGLNISMQQLNFYGFRCSTMPRMLFILFKFTRRADLHEIINFRDNNTRQIGGEN